MPAVRYFTCFKIMGNPFICQIKGYSIIKQCMEQEISLVTDNI